MPFSVRRRPRQYVLILACLSYVWFFCKARFESLKEAEVALSIVRGPEGQQYFDAAVEGRAVLSAGKLQIEEELPDGEQLVRRVVVPLRASWALADRLELRPCPRRPADVIYVRMMNGTETSFSGYTRFQRETNADLSRCSVKDVVLTAPGIKKTAILISCGVLAWPWTWLHQLPVNLHALHVLIVFWLPAMSVFHFLTVVIFHSNIIYYIARKISWWRAQFYARSRRLQLRTLLSIAPVHGKPADETDACAICLDQLCNHTQQMLRLLPCSHWLHTDCYQTWVRSEAYVANRLRCPICRQNITCLVKGVAEV